MKFILNTAVDPHFCALFDSDESRIDYHEWQNRRRDGEELWHFLNKHKTDEIDFIGGVSGPGGFSSLRAGAGVLNSLAFALGISVHAVRADRWQEALLSRQFPNDEVKVVLNSFGDGIWLKEGDVLGRYSVDDLRKKIGETCICGSWLPAEKRQEFANTVELDMAKGAEILLSILHDAEPARQFATAYEVPPV